MPSPAMCVAIMCLLLYCAAVSTAANATMPAPNEVAVHILERFNPLTTVTLVGAYLPVYEAAGFRLMLSFKAFEYNPLNAASMNCFFMDQDSEAWLPFSSNEEGAKTHNGEPAFCARRNFTDNDTDTFAVGMFKRVSFHDKDQKPRFLVEADSPSRLQLLSKVQARGWREEPIAYFRVTKVMRWRMAPSLTLISEILAVRADNISQAAELCPPHQSGYQTRKLDGGNYYAGVEDERLLMLCVAYVQRSLHDLEARENFYSNVRFRDRAIFRLNTCGLADYPVRDALTRNTPIFSPYKGKKRLLCHDQQRLVKDLDGTGRLEGTSQLAKRVYIDEAFEKRDERLRVEYHVKNAFDFPLQYIDMNAVHSF